jgi:hypothetical protein
MQYKLPERFKNRFVKLTPEIETNIGLSKHKITSIHYGLTTFAKFNQGNIN